LLQNQQVEAIYKEDNNQERLINTDKQQQPENVLINSSENNSKNENQVLTKLLEKIKKQREELSQKASQFNINNLSKDSSSCTTSDDLSSLDPIINQNNSHENENSVNKKENQQNVNPSQQNTISLSIEDDSSEFSQIDNLNDIKFSKNERKIIKGIMMSSHNVSSINEMMYNNRLFSICRQNSIVDTNPVDLSHASREPILAGMQEVFDNDVIFHIFNCFLVLTKKNLSNCKS
jgi:hypothetical protein